MSDRQKGVCCILASAFGFALMAFFVRLCDDFGAPVSSFEKSFFRNIVALALALAAWLRTADRSAGFRALTRPAWGVLLLRATLGTIGIFANFYALGHIPIAEAQTLNKTAPFFTVILAWLFLGERASGRQVLVLLLAFAGVALVAKPGFAGADAFPLSMGLMSGFCAGGAYACVRKLGLMRVPGTLIVLAFSAFSCAAAVPFMLHRFDPLTVTQLLVLLGAGVGAAIGQFGITAAYRFAPPRSIAVFDYSSILFAAAFGYVFFAQVPDALSVVGFVAILLAAWRMRTG